MASIHSCVPVAFALAALSSAAVAQPFVPTSGVQFNCFDGTGPGEDISIIAPNGSTGTGVLGSFSAFGAGSGSFGGLSALAGLVVLNYSNGFTNAPGSSTVAFFEDQVTITPSAAFPAGTVVPFITNLHLTGSLSGQFIERTTGEVHVTGEIFSSVIINGQSAGGLSATNTNPGGNIFDVNTSGGILASVTVGVPFTFRVELGAEAVLSRRGRWDGSTQIDASNTLLVTSIAVIAPDGSTILNPAHTSASGTNYATIPTPSSALALLAGALLAHRRRRTPGPAN